MRARTNADVSSVQRRPWHPDTKKDEQGYEGADVQVPSKKTREKKNRTPRNAAVRHQFDAKDFEMMIDWLEMDGNLECLQGAEGKTKVGSKYPMKKAAFQSLANHINENQLVSSKPPLEKLEWDGARNRFLTLQDKYWSLRKVIGGTGWGLDASDAKKKIYTLEAKKNRLCPGFDRLNVLLGNSPAILTAENVFVSGTGASLEQMPIPPAEDDDFIDLEDDEDPIPMSMTSSPYHPTVTQDARMENTSPLVPPEIGNTQGPCHNESRLGDMGQEENGGRGFPIDLSPTASNGSPGAIPGKIVGTKRSASVGKKSSLGRGSGFQSGFVNLLESLIQVKVRALEVKERIQQRHLDEKRGKRVDKMKQSRMQAITEIIKNNAHRSSQDITDFIAALPNLD